MLMKAVNNLYVDKLEFLPNDVELVIARSWCYSVISNMERIGSCEGLICMINNCLYSDGDTYDSSEFVSKYVKMSVYNIKRIISICGRDTLCYILPCNYEQISNKFLCERLGNLKLQIDTLVETEDYDTAFSLIMEIKDISLKHLALIYMKFIYTIQTENKISIFKNSRKKLVNKINHVIKESQSSYF